MPEPWDDAARLEITSVTMPEMGEQFSWKLFRGEFCIARSYDYYATEDAAQAAYDGFCRMMEAGAPIVVKEATDDAR